jgi:hypothetical protein
MVDSREAAFYFVRLLLNGPGPTMSENEWLIYRWPRELRAWKSRVQCQNKPSNGRTEVSRRDVREIPSNNVSGPCLKVWSAGLGCQIGVGSCAYEHLLDCADSRVSMDRFSIASCALWWRGMPIRTKLFTLLLGGYSAAWRRPRIMARAKAHCPVPSLGRQWIRSCPGHCKLF